MFAKRGGFGVGNPLRRSTVRIALVSIDEQDRGAARIERSQLLDGQAEVAGGGGLFFVAGDEDCSVSGSDQFGQYDLCSGDVDRVESTYPVGANRVKRLVVDFGLIGTDECDHSLREVLVESGEGSCRVGLY